jgi:hypothetical protein
MFISVFSSTAEKFHPSCIFVLNDVMGCRERLQEPHYFLHYFIDLNIKTAGAIDQSDQEEGNLTSENYSTWI